MERNGGNLLQSVKYTEGSLEVIDQLKLPGELVYEAVRTQQDAWNVIREMKVRGAPLIAIVAALGLAVDVHSKKSEFGDSSAKLVQYIHAGTAYLRTSRPTAAPLFIVMDSLDKFVSTLLAAKESAASILSAFIAKCGALLEEDVNSNRAMGDYGVNYILSLVKRPKLRVLTICNTGSLATAGYGTALGVIRTLHERGRLEHVYACETRPYNQGARLTAFEIVYDKLPGTLIPDSAASALMAVKGVDVVVVGGDRVTANGDLANKIGTYQLALAANYHNVPFFTAITTSVVDTQMACGARIHVEERAAHEMTSIGSHQIAPAGINVWNPAFDVTPSSLIHGIITEVGVATHATAPCADEPRIIDMVGFLLSKKLIPPPTPEAPATAAGDAAATAAAATEVVSYAKPVKTHVRYQRMTERDIVEYFVTDEQFCAMLRIQCDTDTTVEQKASQLTVKEVGDGNLNFVYIISGPSGDHKHTLIAKQALPYVRCVGENWPLSLDRATFESAALVEEHRLCPEHVPEVYRFEESRALIVMRYIEPPHIILRKVLIDKVYNSHFISHVATFAAKTLFGTSCIALSGSRLREEVSKWSKNTSMCGLTEQVIFTDPYYAGAQYNHWENVSPHLDNVIKNGIYADNELKIAVAALKEKFLTSTQALLHGDLHTGSIMVSETSTFVIDPEFAFYGPIGFDIGLFLANMLFAYTSHCYHPNGGDGIAYSQWLLSQMVHFQKQFESEFVALWTRSCTGEVFNRYVFNTEEAASAALLEQAQRSFMAQLWRDSMGFAGAELIRRVVGIAHVADLESNDNTSIHYCEDEALNKNIRARCQYLTLSIARKMIMAGTSTADCSAKNGIENMTALASLVSTMSAHDNAATLSGFEDYNKYSWP